MPFISGIGAPELIIILVIALVVVGPGRLPDVGSALGKSIREFRKAASDVTDATRLDDDKPQSAGGPAPVSAPAAPTPAPAAASPAIPAASTATIVPTSETADLPEPVTDEQPTPTA